jgi:hypothetical protein
MILERSQMFMSDFTKITVNGRDYDSIDQMPPDIREIYSQAMAAMRESETPNTSGVVKKDIVSHTVKESFTYNGRHYNSLDEMPPEVRSLFESMSKLPLDTKVSDVKILSDRTIIPERRDTEQWGLTDDRPERDPRVAWMLVIVLSAVVLVLLFLLYLAGIHHKGG